MTSRIRIDYLSTFLLVVERGSLLAAAEELGTSVGTVSKQIEGVEGYFDSKLLNRDSTGVKTTKAGKAVYNTAKEVIREIEGTRRLLKNLERRHLDVASGCFGIPLIAELKKEYSKTHPRVGFSIELHGTRTCFKLLDEGEVSLIFAGYMPPEFLGDRYFTAELGKDRLVFITPIDHELASRESVSLEDIKKTPIVKVLPAEDISKRIEVELSKHGLTSNDLMAAGLMDSIFAQIYGVVSGFGCAITSFIHAKRFEEAGLIRILDVDEFTDERRIMLIGSKKSLENPEVKEFVDFAKKMWDHSSSK